jgi:hypothetical protein
MRDFEVAPEDATVCADAHIIWGTSIYKQFLKGSTP